MQNPIPLGQTPSIPSLTSLPPLQPYSALPFGLFLPAAVNEAAGVATQVGLTFPLANFAIGDSWHLRWTLFVGTSAAAVGGLTLSIAIPTITAAAIGVDGHSTSLTTFAKRAASSGAGMNTLLAALPLVTFDASTVSTRGLITIDLDLLTISALSNCTLFFQRNTGGETMSILPGSNLSARRIG